MIHHTFIPTPLHFNSVERGIKEGISIMLVDYPEAKDMLVIERIMDDVRNLTALSVALQHEADYEGTLDAYIHTETNYLMTNKLSSQELSAVGLLKCIECILIQFEREPIEELREITDEELYSFSFLINYKNELKDLIIRSIPGYDDLPWDLE